VQKFAVKALRPGVGAGMPRQVKIVLSRQPEFLRLKNAVFVGWRGK
jgi:hypothetical protein